MQLMTMIRIKDKTRPRKVNNVLLPTLLALASVVVIAQDSAARPPLNQGRAVAASSETKYANDFSDLNQALAAIGASTATLIINSAQEINVRLVSPPNVTVKFVGDGVVSRGTLNIRGPIEAPLNKSLISGSGAISLSGNVALSEIFPQWFGAIGDGKAEDAPALQLAVDAALEAGVPVSINSTFNLGTTSLVLRGAGQLRGSNIGIGSGVGSRLLYRGGAAAVQVNDGTGVTTQHWVIRDLVIDGRGAGAYGIQLGTSTGTPKSAGGLIDNVVVRGFVIGGVRVVASQLSTLRRVRALHNPGDGFILDDLQPGGNTATDLIDCRADANGKRGFYIKSAAAFQFISCSAENNGEEGMLLEQRSGNPLYALSFLQPYFERNNTARQGSASTDYADFKAYSVDASVMGQVQIINGYFTTRGKYNYFLNLSKGAFTVTAPHFSGKAGMPGATIQPYGKVYSTATILAIQSPYPSSAWNISAGVQGSYLEMRRGLVLTTYDKTRPALSAVGGRGMRITTDKSVLGSAPALEVVGGNGMLLTDHEIDAKAKIGRIGVKHFSNALKPFFWGEAISSAMANELRIGGGGMGNAATSINFFTAVDNKTTGGELAGSFTNYGAFAAAKAITSGVVTLPDAPMIVTDATRGNLFRVTVGGNRTLAAPLNPTDGQVIIWEFIQDERGNRTITLSPDFVLGLDVKEINLTPGANKRDFMRCIYNVISGQWYVLDFKRGY